MANTDQNIATLRSLIEGAYDLDEWHMPEGVMRAPRIAGRFMLVNGAVSSIMHDRSGAVPTSVVMYGTYTLSTTEFMYGYDEPMRVTKTQTGATISHALPWEGKRVFAIDSDGNFAHLRATSGHEFYFTPSGFTYSMAGTVVRVWRRIADYRR